MLINYSLLSVSREVSDMIQPYKHVGIKSLVMDLNVMREKSHGEEEGVNFYDRDYGHV